MVHLSSFVDLTNPLHRVCWAAVVPAAVAFAGYLRGRREANFRKREIEVLSRSLEQLGRLRSPEEGLSIL